MSTEFPDEFWHIEAEVSVIPLLTFEDVAAVATDLNERLLHVRSGRQNFMPTMAAGPDLAVQLILTAVGAIAAGEYLRTFARLLAEDTYKVVRAGLLRLVGKANERDDGRTWNLGITVGSQHFYFPSPMDDAEFLSRLAAMHDVLGQMPAGLLTGTLAPPEPNPGWSWDADRRLWVPTPGIDAALGGRGV